MINKQRLERLEKRARIHRMPWPIVTGSAGDYTGDEVTSFTYGFCDQDMKPLPGGEPYGRRDRYPMERLDEVVEYIADIAGREPLVIHIVTADTAPQSDTVPSRA